MRTLVEQTHREVSGWLERAGLDSRQGVHVLLGGLSPSDWHLEPERDCVLIGTQDMLLSRALNRGYGAGRARWPMEYGLLNVDCLWVMDEVQLMGVALATSAQLQAFASSDEQAGRGGRRTMIPHGVEVFVALDPVDLRWSFDRLAGLCQERLGRDARSGALFVFFGRRRQALVLFFDGTGMCLFYKRLDRGTFQVPEAGGETATVTIDERVLDDLLDGIAVEGMGQRSRMPVRH